MCMAPGRVDVSFRRRIHFHGFGVARQGPWWRSLPNCSRSSVVSPSRSPSSTSCCLFHLLRDSLAMPSSSAIFGIDFSEERLSWTASDLNSGGQCGVGPGTRISFLRTHRLHSRVSVLPGEAQFACRGFSGVHKERLKDSPYGGCALPAPGISYDRYVCRGGAFALHSAPLKSEQGE